MEIFYKSVIESVVVFCIIVWHKGASLNEKKHVNTIRKQAEKITGLTLDTFDSIYNIRLIKKAKAIMNDLSHPLNVHYNVLPSGKRLRTMACKTLRHIDSFVPNSILICNNMRILPNFV